MDLPRLQPTRLCMHEGSKIMFFKGCFYDVSWQNFNTINNPSHTILVSNESSGLIISICVKFNDEIYHLAHVIKKQQKNTHFLVRICIWGVG